MFSRPIPLTTQSVTVRSSPKGFPTARTHWPTFTPVESPKRAAGRGWSAVTLSTARSVSGSLPITWANNLVLSEKRTSTSEASPTTWLFVIMWPFGSTMTPEPDPVEFGTRSPDPSRDRPGAWMGKMLTTEDLASSARSVMTLCRSSNRRSPGDSLCVDVPWSVPARPTPASPNSHAERTTISMRSVDENSRVFMMATSSGDYTLVRLTLVRLQDTRFLICGERSGSGRLGCLGPVEMREPMGQIVAKAGKNYNVVGPERHGG